MFIAALDINVLRGIATIVVMLTFFAICWWVYFYRSREYFNEAAQLPFNEDAPHKPTQIDSLNADSVHTEPCSISSHKGDKP